MGVPYLGICMTETHVNKLELRAKQWVFAQMQVENSKFFRPALVDAVVVDKAEKGNDDPDDVEGNDDDHEDTDEDSPSEEEGGVDKKKKRTKGGKKGAAKKKAKVAGGSALKQIQLALKRSATGKKLNLNNKDEGEDSEDVE